jgi:prephenate dehydrogenase
LIAPRKLKRLEVSKEGDFFLKDANIAIVGLGLMGGSLALALRGHCAQLLGLDPDPATLELTRGQKIVDLAGPDPAQLLPQADLVILAAPVPAILDWLHVLPQYVQHACIVLDIGSTKRAIVDAMDLLPSNFDPLGGHPICGREQLSLEYADATLYRDAPFVLTPLARTSGRARSAAEQIASLIGAHLVVLDPSEHDRILASISHLPFLIASALVLATRAEVTPLTGPGFRSTTRLAATPSSMMLGVIQSNRQNILQAIDRFQYELNNLKSSIVDLEGEALGSLLDTARRGHQALISKSP